MTVLLVTHSMADAAEFCNRGIVLSQGRVVFEGFGKEAVEYYFHHEYGTPTGRKQRANESNEEATIKSEKSETERTCDALDPFHLYSSAIVDVQRMKQFGDSMVRAQRVLVTGRDDKPRRVFQQGDWLRVYVDFSVGEPTEVPLAGLQLMNAKGILVHGRNSLQFEATPPTISDSGTLRCVQDIELNVDVGEYTIETGLAELPKDVWARRHVYSPSDIAPQIRLLCHVTCVAAISVIYRHQGSPCLFTHYGVADLPSHQQLTLLPAIGQNEVGAIE
jgi:lipopolysaccharide transport system ATP-binding protein